MLGLTGNDVLLRLGGNDTLNRGAGTDRLESGQGNDILADAGDAVAEALNAGADQVSADYNYALSTNFENLLLTGTGAINGTGNALDNRLTGNVAANVLNGGAGNDTDSDTAAEMAILIQGLTNQLVATDFLL